VRTTFTTNTTTFHRSRIFRKGLAPTAFVFAAATLLAACGGGSSDSGSGSSDGGGGQATSQGGGNAVVSVKNQSGVGMTLVNSSGQTLYFSDQEKSGKISCTGSCLGFWFPLTTSSTTVKTPSGVSGQLGTIKRSDNGKLQVTYNGAPLYTFKLDTATGDAKGNDFSDQFGSAHFTWHAAGSTAKSTTPTQSQSTMDNGGYGNY
jgi:predicted lipoprotein with Yx(FWY)xxD motif